MLLKGKQKIKRLVIYFFYDKFGVVDRYIEYMLNDVLKNCTELFVVCNGVLTSAGRDIFDKLTPHVLVRENVGFDVWAYKSVIDLYGWEKLEDFDEIVMMNHTIMGPVYPLEEMFYIMNNRDVDFWGITKYHKTKEDPFKTISCGYIPEHIQSHFIAVRQNIIKSKIYQSYWNNIVNINNYADAVGKHEAIFTEKISKAGFKWDTYVDTSDLEGFTYDPIIMCPKLLIEKYRCPIFKRRSFFHDKHDLLKNSVGRQARELIDYLKNYNLYDVGMIWENILRTNNMASIKRCLNLNYILPKNKYIGDIGVKKIVLVIHIYFEDSIEYCYDYALSMPKYSDLIITTDTDKKKEVIEKKFKTGYWSNVLVLKIQNRGRDISSLLVGVAPYLKKYDYVCFMHDKKVSQLDLGIKGYAFSEKCFQNMLGSKQLVANIINLFEKEPYLGLLCPPPPNHAEYYFTLAAEWSCNYDITKELADKLGITIPMSGFEEPIAPIGTMFWFRPEALQLLFDKGWNFNDFPEEPNCEDGTLLHAIERIYPFVAQQSGFYSAWCLSDDFSSTELDNLVFMLREINLRLFRRYGILTHNNMLMAIDSDKSIPQAEIINTQQQLPLRILLKRKIKEKIPNFLWVFFRHIYHFFKGKKWIG